MPNKYRTKLTDSDVREIRAIYASNKTMQDLAAMYDVSFSTIRLVLNRKGAYEKETPQKDVDTLAVY